MDAEHWIAIITGAAFAFGWVCGNKAGYDEAWEERSKIEREGDTKTNEN